MFRKNNLFLKFLVLLIIMLAGFLFSFTPISKAESVILYQENFDDNIADNWQEYYKTIEPVWHEEPIPGIVWGVSGGKYNLDVEGWELGAKSVYQGPSQNIPSWGDFVFSFDAELKDGVDRIAYFRMQDDDNKYFLGLRAFWKGSPGDTPVIYLAKCYNGIYEGNQYEEYFACYRFDDDNKDALNNETAHIDIEAFGNRIRIFYNHQLVIDWQETTENYPKSGTIGFYGWSGHDTAVNVSWDNVIVRTDWPEEPVEQNPPTIGLFNQYKSDEETILKEQEITAGDSVVFKAIVDDPDGDLVKLQVEVREYPDFFHLAVGANDSSDWILNSDFISAGSEAIAATNISADGEYHWRARAVDENGNASEWRHFGNGGIFDSNFDFKIKTVPLYTQVYSPYPSQNDTEDWFENEYAAGYTENYWCGSEIKDCGCAITSAVMALRYHDIIKDVEDNDVNPGIINQWLKNAISSPIGYYSGNINWMAVEEYARDPQNNQLRVVFNGKYNRNYKDYPDNNHQEIEDMLNDDLESYQPVIMRDDRIGHFFVATEKLAGTYSIRDPLWYNTKTLNQEITSDDNGMPYNNYKRDYNNHYGGIRRFYALGPYDVGPFRFASLDFVIASPAELLITYSNGSEIKRLGKDPVSGEEYNEIPNGSYTTEGIGNHKILDPPEHQIKSVWIPNPMDGEYQIKVIGTGQGSYDFYSTVTDSGGNSKTYSFAGNTQTGLATSYDLDYTSSSIEEAEIIPQDTISPVTGISIVGVQGKNDWHISDAEISLSAKDNEDGTGVFKTQYSLDDGAAWTEYENPFVITDEGIHAVLYYSEDFAGNAEKIKTRIIKIDKIPPEAEIYFNAQKQKLAVDGIDNLTELPAVTQESKCLGKRCKQKQFAYTVEDEAGHTLKLDFTNFIHRRGVIAHLNKLQYNEDEPIKSEIRLNYTWTVNKKTKIINFLSQTIINPKDFWVKALYRQKKDQTILLIKDRETGKKKIKQTLDGLVIIKLFTQSGETRYEY